MDDYQDYVYLIGQKMCALDLVEEVWNWHIGFGSDSLLQNDMIELGLLDGSEDCWYYTELEVTEEFLKCVLLHVDYQCSLYWRKAAKVITPLADIASAVLNSIGK